MPRATCRCGEILTFPAEGPERIVCPKCSARIRVRRTGPNIAGAANATGPGDSDGFIRFRCPCGRRLKVRVEDDMADSGKCPDCGRVVPIPANSTQPASSETLSTGHPEAITEELSAEDIAMLEKWKQTRTGAGAGAGGEPTANAGGATTTLMPIAPKDKATAPQTPPPGGKAEAGMRICPRCGKPVHLSAIVCRACGAHVPKR